MSVRSSGVTSAVAYGFVKDDTLVYKPLKIKINQPDSLNIILVDNNNEIVYNKTDVIPILSSEDLDAPPNDLVHLSEVNNASILHSLRERFYKDMIYTSIGSILVAINPFKWINNLYHENLMTKYASHQYTLGSDPHVFAIAQKALEGIQKGKNQSLIISGESGAGKTEATKQCLNYLTTISTKGSSSDNGVQVKILKSSPVLEAWGNAKTLRNNNSSRFGKFIEIYFNNQFNIVGASNTTYLLEKSRVVYQQPNERNYHIFYQLLSCGNIDLLTRLNILDIASDPNIAGYLNVSGCIRIDDLNDTEEYLAMYNAFIELGFDAEIIYNLFQSIAGILQAGNIAFIPNSEDVSNNDTCVINPATYDWFERVATSWGVKVTLLEKSLLYRIVQTGGGTNKRGSINYKPFDTASAKENVDAVAKALYNRCFDYIVGHINLLTDTKGTGKDQIRMIGILDIFGFEVFQKNSFEQLCINLANESLQQHFNYNIFKAEMELYRNENVAVPVLDYSDNQDVLDLIMKKRIGIFAMLDEEVIVPRGSWEGFLSKVAKAYSDHPRLRVSKISARDFTIVHYAGPVVYDPALFLFKNKDTLSNDIADLLKHSTIPFISELFTSIDDEMETVETTAVGSPSKRQSIMSGGAGQRQSIMSGGAAVTNNKLTVGKKFCTQLESLMLNLSATEPQYIRCIKANSSKKPNIIESPLVYEQLSYSGVFEAVVIMKKGYPFRMSLLEFRRRFQLLTLIKNPKSPDNDAVRNYVLSSSSGADGSLDAMRQTIYSLTGFLSAPAGIIVAPGQLRKLIEHVGTLENGYKEILKGVHIGITLVFYRSDQNILLEKLRLNYLSQVVLTTQRCCRGSLIRQLIRRVKHNLSAAYDILQPHNNDKYDTDKVSGIIIRYSRALQALDAVSTADITRVVGQEVISALSRYNYQLTLQNEMTNTLKPLLDNGTLFDDIQFVDETLAKVKSIHFKETVYIRTGVNNVMESHVLVLSWEDNLLFQQVDAVVSQNREIMMIKSSLDGAIQRKDELSLSIILGQLKELKDSGLIDQSFLADKVITATNITIIGSSNMGKWIDEVMPLLTQYKYTGDDASGYNNDPTLYNKLKADTALSSITLIDQAKATILKLVELRLLASKGDWSKIWELLNEEWMHLLFNQNVTTKVLYIPIVIRNLLSEEIVNYSVSCIRRVIYPEIIKYIDSSHKGSTTGSSDDGPIFISPLNVNTRVQSPEPLKSLIDIMSRYEQFLVNDDVLKSSLCVARERFNLRHALHINSLSALETSLSAIQYLPHSDAEYINASEHIKFLQVSTSLRSYVTKDVPIGEPGSRVFPTNNIENFKSAITSMNSFVFNKADVFVNLFVKYCDDVYNTRVMLAALMHSTSSTNTTKYDVILDRLGEYLLESAYSTDSHDSRNVYQDVKESALAQFTSIKTELLHLKSLSIILFALNTGHIKGEVGNLRAESDVSSSEITDKITLHQASLIPNNDVKLLLSTISYLTDIRAAFNRDDWNKIEAIYSQMKVNTANFRQLHSHCRVEIMLVYEEITDRKIRNELMKRVKDSSCVDKQLVDVKDTGMIQLKEYIQYVQSFDTISDTGGGVESHKVSFETNYLLLCCKLIYCLRKAIIGNNWEPDHIYCGNLSMEELMDPSCLWLADTAAEVQAAVKHIIGLGQYRSIEIDQLNTLLDAYIQSEASKSRSISMDSNDSAHGSDQGTGTIVCVSILLVYAMTIGSHECCHKEFNHIFNISHERRARALSLIAMYNFPITGTVDQLNVANTDCESLALVINYIRTYLRSDSEEKVITYSLVINTWLPIMEHVLQYRVAVKSFLPANPVPDGLIFIAHDLLTYLENHNIDEDINTIVSSNDEEVKVFPVAELELLGEYVVTNKMMLSLIEAVSVGRPLYFLGSFDCSAVCYMHLNDIVSSIATYGKEHTVPGVLIKLVEFTMAIITMREALMNQGWHIEDKAAKFGEVKFSARISRKQPDIEILKAIYDCHEHFLELKKKVRIDTSATNTVGTTNVCTPLPPACIDEEMGLIIQEVNLIVQDYALCSSFTPGNLTLGVASNTLVIRDLSTDALNGQLNKIKDVFPSVDSYRYNHLFISIESAKELIAIRNQLMSINETYTQHDNSCLFACTDLESIMGSTFISEAINSAINSVNSLLQYNTAGRFRFIDEWEPVSNLLLNSNYLLAFNTTEEESDILLCETFSRIFNSKVLSTLWSIDRHFVEYFELLAHKMVNSDVNPTTEGKLVDKCNGHLQQLHDACQYYQFLLETASGSNKEPDASLYSTTLSARAKYWIRKNLVITSLYNSCVYMTHVLKALRVSNYDGEILRDWRVDQYGLKGTPTITILEETKNDNSSSKHSMQSIARSYLSYPDMLHPVLHKTMQIIINDIEDEVTFDELVTALNDGQATGAIGSITNIDVCKLQHAIDRVSDGSNNISVVSKETLLLYRSCQFLLQLRIFTVNQQYSDGIDLMLHYFFPTIDNSKNKPIRVIELIKHVYRGQYHNVHSLPAEEIVKLCINTFDYYWQIEASRILSSTNMCICGGVGAFDLSLIDYDSLDYCFEYLNYHLELNPKTDRMKNLLFVIRRLRFTTAATRVLLNKYNDKKSGSSEDVLDSTLVPGMTTPLGINPHWASTYSLILTLSKSILSNASLNDFDSMIVNSITNECQLSSQYSEYMIAGIQLEVCLNIQSIFFNEASGLQLIKFLLGEMKNAVGYAEYAGIGSLLSAAMESGAYSTLDVWWSHLLQLAHGILSIQDTIHTAYYPPDDNGAPGTADRTEYFHINPGTDMFPSLMPAIDAVVNTIDILQGLDGLSVTQESPLRVSLIQILRDDSARGDSRLFVITDSVLKVKSALIQAKVEHEKMTMLRDIMNIDSVTIVENEKDIALEITHGPMHGMYTTSTKNAEEFSQYTLQHVAKVEGVTLTTEAGKLLQKLANYHLMLRDSVYRSDLSAAHSIAMQVVGMDVLSTRNDDAETTLHYCGVVSIKRSIEKGMLHCVIPTLVGWTRLAEGKLFSFCINDSVLEEAIEDCHTAHMEVIQQYPLMEHLYSCGIALLNLIHSIRCGKWTSNSPNETETPEYEAISQLLALCPEKVSVAAAIASTHLVSSNNSRITGLCDTLTVEEALSAFDQYIHDNDKTSADIAEFVDTGVPLLPVVKKYLNTISVAIHHELSAIRLGSEVNGLLSDVFCTGYPGHVLIPTSLFDRLNSVISLLDKHQIIVNLDYYLLSCYHSCKVLLILLSNLVNSSTDLGTFVSSFLGDNKYPTNRLLDFMSYMSMKPDHNIPMATICHKSMEVAWQSRESLLAMLDRDYTRLFEQASAKYTGHKVQLQDCLLEHTQKALNLCTSSEKEQIPLLGKVAKEIFNCDLHDVGKLHPIVVKIFVLLSAHTCFVEQYNAFHALTYSVPIHYTVTDGTREYNQHIVPGEISTTHIQHDGLIEIYHMVRCKGLATYLDKTTFELITNNDDLPSPALILSDLAKLIYSVRRGYSTSNEALVHEGLDQLKGIEVLLNKYNNHFNTVILEKYKTEEYYHYYPPLTNDTKVTDELSATMVRIKALNPHRYPLITKGLVFLDYYYEEILVTQQDMIQRDILHILNHSIETDGVSMDDEPPNSHSSIDTEGLKAALDHLNDKSNVSYNKWVVKPSCPTAVLKFNTVRVLYNIRTLAIGGKWVRLLKFIEEEINYERDFGMSMAEAAATGNNYKALKEVYSANKLGYCQLAKEKALKAYSTGNIRRLKSSKKKDNMDIVYKDIDTEVVAAAISALLEVKDDWFTEDLYCHRYSIGVLDVVRRNVKAGNWFTVYDSLYLAFTIPEQNMEISRRLHNSVMSELSFAYDYAKYHLSIHCLQCALAQGKMSGEVGSVDTSSININTVSTAIIIVKNLIKFVHPDVEAALREAEFMLELRKAEFQGIWLKDPPDMDSLDAADITQPTIDEYIITTLLRTRLSPAATYLSGSNNLVSTVPESVAESVDFEYGDVFSKISSYKGDKGVIKATHILDTPTMEASSRIQYVRDFFDYVLQQDDDLFFVLDSMNQSPTCSIEELLTRADGISNNELVFARQELDYRLACIKLLFAIRTRGIEGTPGDIISVNAHEESLVDSIELGQKMSFQPHQQGYYILRDATYLLKLRSLARLSKWPDLLNLLSDMEHTNTSSLSSADTSAEDKLTKPILLPVWNEMKLVKAEILFQLCYTKFATELGVVPNITAPRYSSGSEQINAMMEILTNTEKAFLLWPKSPAFERLIETISIALDLRILNAYEKGTSPMSIIKSVAIIKRRDEINHNLSFVTMLQQEITELQFQHESQSLSDKIIKEILGGQKYLMCPLGFINKSDIDVDRLSVLFESFSVVLKLPIAKSFYSSTTYNEERFKSSMMHIAGDVDADDYELLNVTDYIIAFRKYIRDDDWVSVRRMIDSKLYTSSSLISAEVERIHLELENRDIHKLLDGRLYEGRLMDVMKIARSISKHRRSVVISNNKSDVVNDGDSGRRRSSMYNRRVSATALPVDFTIALVNLEEAVKEGMKLKKRSVAVNAFIQAADTIYNMRVAILNTNWVEAERIVADIIRVDTLPAQCVEEIIAVKKGLEYRRVSMLISTTIVSSAPLVLSNGHIDTSSIQYAKLKEVLVALGNSNNEMLRDSDVVVPQLFKVGTLLCDIRHCMVASAASPEEVTVSPLELILEFEELLPSTLTRMEALLNIEESETESIRRNSSIMMNEWIVGTYCCVSVHVVNELSLYKKELVTHKISSDLIKALEMIPNMQNINASMDSYHIAPLQQAIDNYNSYNVLGDKSYIQECEGLYNTACLVLRFRIALNKSDLDSFQSLVSESRYISYANNNAEHRVKEYSQVYGVQELHSYQTMLMASQLHINEVTVALTTGCIQGPLDAPDVNSINCDRLMESILMTKEVMAPSDDMWLNSQSLLEEAEIVLNLRNKIKNDDIPGVRDVMNEFKAKGFVSKYAVHEINHAAYICKFHEVYNRLLYALYENTYVTRMDKNASNDVIYSNVAVRILNLEDVLSELKQVISYSSDLLGGGSNSPEGMAPIEVFSSFNKADIMHNYALAQQLLALLKAIQGNNWDEDTVATGAFHPENSINTGAYDPFLVSFLEYIRQHEVTNRMLDVHKQVKSLGVYIQNNKDIFKAALNRAQRTNSVRTIIANISTAAVAKAATTPAKVAPVQTASKRRVTITVDDKNNGPVTKNTSDKESAVPVASRRRSIGMIGSNIKKVAPTLGKASSLVVPKKASFSNAGPSVAVLLYSTCWIHYPQPVNELYNAVRNELIDRVIRRRLQYGCLDGNITSDPHHLGNIIISPTCCYLLEVVLFDTSRYLRIASYYDIPFKFSHRTLQLKLAIELLLRCRKCILSDEYDALYDELRTHGYLVSSVGMRTKEVKTLEEIEIIEVHCWERISESKIESALKVLGDTQLAYDSAILQHQCIAELRELVRRDPHVMTDNAKELPLYYSHLKAIATNIHDLLLCGLVDCGSIYNNSFSLSDLTADATHNFNRYQQMATHSLVFIRLDHFLPLLNAAVDRITSIYTEKIQSLWQTTVTSPTKAAVPCGHMDIKKAATNIFSEIAGVATYDDDDDDSILSIEDFVNEADIIHSRDDNTYSITLVTFENLKDIVTKINDTPHIDKSELLWLLAVNICYIILEVEATQQCILPHRKHIRQVIVPRALSTFLDKFKLRNRPNNSRLGITVVEIAKLLASLRKETMLSREDVLNAFTSDDAYSVYVDKVQAMLMAIKSYLSISVDKYKKIVATAGLHDEHQPVFDEQRLISINNILINTLH